MYITEVVIMLLCLEGFSSGKSGPEELILGGYGVNIAKFPHHVLIIAIDTEKKWAMTQCGGSLLSSLWVLSAAHCFWGWRESITYKLRMGIDSKMQDGVLYDVKKWIIHPKYHDEDLWYSSKSSWFDLVMIKVDGHVTFIDTIQPVPLPKEKEKVEDTKKLYITGFGQTFTDPNTSDQETTLNFELRGLTTKFSAMENCGENAQKYSKYEDLAFCYKAFKDVWSKGTCPGDSGGGVVAHRENSSLVIFGVHSRAFACGSPMVAIKVTKFADWIREIIALC